MPITQEEIDDLFTYHPPKSGQSQRYEAIREAGRAFGQAIIANTLPSADQTAAVRKAREAVMTANASIALEKESVVEIVTVPHPA